MALKRVLIANRGEIGLRLVRGCHAASVEAVAAHVAGEADAPYVEAADGAVEVTTFLDAGVLVDAARAAGCDALHPGYGFLSERPELAEACAAAGIVFVGPSPDALRRAGRQGARRASWRWRPASRSCPAASDPATIGFPVLVKAAAGGGGRGMRVVRSAGELEAAMASAAREAEAAFGDPTLYAERYLEGARHVEVQALRRRRRAARCTSGCATARCSAATRR